MIDILNYLFKITYGAGGYFILFIEKPPKYPFYIVYLEGTNSIMSFHVRVTGIEPVNPYKGTRCR
ncbi:hypothetical protein ABH966_001956 [Lysinibacillus sp. RC46]